MKILRIKIIVIAMFSILFFIAGGEIARSQTSERAILKLNRTDSTLYPTNFLNITTIGKEGKPIEGLKSENFQVFEDGKEQKVLDVVQSDEKGTAINVALVIDTSGSMNPAMEDTKKAATAFLEYLSPQDKVAIISFSNIYTLQCDFTGDREILKSAIKELKPRGGTGLYYSVHQTLGIFDKVEEGNRAIIVLTDGRNNMPGSIEQCIDKSRFNGVPVFTIGLGPMVDKASLSHLASETGGIFRFAPTSSELEEIYKSLANQLKKQYWVKYKASPQHWPKTQVKASVKLQKVPGAAGLESLLTYVVPLQWWKLITAYILIELALIFLTYFLFKLFWRKMNMDPVAATRLSIIILMVLTIVWFTLMFVRFVPIWLFLLIAFGQLIILFIPIKLMAK
ncbi:MAG: VWA domain-containing protein [Candidatus Eremiobacteraeota bacterium]|nr:VWA domain-containing protein [Candidatus Eremiobacteraeota bacterium]